jgi:hypothetical protein
MRRIAAIVLCGTAGIAGAATDPRPDKQRLPLFCPETSIDGLGAHAADSARIKDFRVYENGGGLNGRSIPGIACRKRQDEDRLVSRGGIFQSDAGFIAMKCKYSREQIRGYSQYIERYNQILGSSASFQRATGCRGASASEAAKAHAINSQVKLRPPLPPAPINEARWRARIQAAPPAGISIANLSKRIAVMASVNESGRVTDCRAAGTSRDPVLDAAACEGMRKYARFRPATDKYGENIPGLYQASFAYRPRAKSK